MNDLNILKKNVNTLEKLQANVPLTQDEENAITTAISAIEQLKTSGNSLEILMTEILSWSTATFDTPPNPAKLYHLMKEVDDELIPLLDIHSDEENRTTALQAEIIEEYADCFILLMASAKAFGLNGSELMQAAYNKHEINKKRQWGPADENGVHQHIEEEE